MNFKRAIILTYLILAHFCEIFAQASPYPPSSVIDSVVWDFGTHIQLAPGSDLWPLTWADNDFIYTSWGDGGGFGGTNNNGRVLIGVGRIEGIPPNLYESGGNQNCFNIWGGINPESGQSATEGKCNTGLICIGGILYAYIQKQGTWEKCKLWTSVDHGRTWIDNGWIFDESGRAFAEPVIIQFGKNYSGARDEYVYMYTRKSGNNEMFLARCHKDSLLIRSAYDFFVGTPSSPGWSNDINNKVAVFRDDNGLEWGGAVFYNDPLDRYIMFSRHNDNGGLGVFEAPEPWGPGTTISYVDNFNGMAPRNFTVSTKWVSGDGTEFWMVYSAGSEDAFNIIKGRLTLNTLPDSTPPSVPSGFNVLPASDSQIDLSWNASSDRQSGVSYYKIYRNGTVVGQSSSTSYSDTGLNENTAYTYQVSAVNGAGVESNLSLAVNATTLVDTTPPTIVSAGIGSSLSQVIVSYSEPVEQNSATNITNYSIDNGITIFSSSLDPDFMTATLTTSAHAEDITYMLTVNNVLDRAQGPNQIAPNTQIPYIFAAELSISNLTVASGREYEIDEPLANESLTYIDRTYTYSDIPAAFLGGATYIRTANDDKFSEGEQFLSFEVNKPVKIYIAHDDRYQVKPDWLSGFSATAQKLFIADIQFTIYEKSFAAGSVILGGNTDPAARASNNMYTVIITGQDTSSPQLDPPTGLRILK